MLALATALALAVQAAPPMPAAPETPADAIAADWRPIPDDDLLIVDLAGGHRIVIRLAPERAPVHVANIRKLARAHWWDATSVYRVQDNYVVQWGDRTESKALPDDVVANPPAEYEFARSDHVSRMTRTDPYSANAGITADGWPEASGPWRRDQPSIGAWLPHCYGMVGAGRGYAPSTGSGAELYAVIGHSPRHLDHNIALIGRVIEGMEYFSSLARGHGELGFYLDTETPMPIVTVRLASDMPAADRPHFEYRAADNPRFAAYLRVRENRDDAFFTVPAGGADLCNVPLPVRRAPAP